MTTFPEYQDIFSISKLHNGEFPCIVSKQVLEENVLLHHHDFIELSLVIAGEGTEIINGNAYPIQSGTLTFLLPHHLHEIHIPKNGSIHKYLCMFDISILFGSQTDADLGNLLLQSGQDLPSHAQLDPQTAEELRSIFDKIEAEFLTSQTARNSYLRAKLIEALVLYVRSQNIHDREKKHVNNAEFPKMIWNIVQHINTHYMYSLSLEDLSIKFKTSVSTISRSFKEEMGQSFLEYLHRLRVRRACGLLLNTDMNIFEIAEETGFESFRTFSRVFKEVKGMSASEFRKKHHIAR